MKSALINRRYAGFYAGATAMLAGLVLVSCASQPKDDAELTEVKFENLMGTRYTEILLVFGNGLTKNFMAGVYNTTGLNGANPAGGGDSSPAAILDKIDMNKVKEDNGALSTVKNGPRLWTVDHIGGKFGKERDFQGLKARWVMWFPIPDAIREGKDLSYALMEARRSTTMGINKGSRVYILDDPTGTSFVMKSASLIKDPNQKFEDLKDLGSRLKPATGWKFRTLILDQDLEFMTDNGVTNITQDEIGNTYDRVGGPYSNFKP
ncbi:MAG: hypothetical protein WBW33_12240 [Bryobacteraceae bacterium]